MPDAHMISVRQHSLVMKCVGGFLACRSAVDQLTVNQPVEGSIPSAPAFESSSDELDLITPR